MITPFLRQQLEYYDSYIRDCVKESHLKVPEYFPQSHYLDLTDKKYFVALIALRQAIKLTTDYFFSVEQKAFCLDLFMYTSSISSPMGLGSDSEAIPFKFGTLDTFLVDSSQFGFEPLLINGIEKTYCYLPSMRGENPNERHLNQFFHCEAEIIGNLATVSELAENYFKTICEALLLLPCIVQKLSQQSSKTENSLQKVLNVKSFPTITFDDAVMELEKNNFKSLIKYSESGRDMTSAGEYTIAKLLNFDTPFWITNYDRDRVPFYQKPDPKNKDKVLCADLILPSLFSNSFGGEVLGAGQRQDNANEMYESLQRQGVSIDSYEWYIKLRNLSTYKMTSGFGLGIERFISWAIGLKNIRDAIIYPRLKNIITIP